MSLQASASFLGIYQETIDSTAFIVSADIGFQLIRYLRVKGMKQMQLSVKVIVTLFVLVVSLYLLDQCLHSMNQPSDLRLYSGLAGTLVLLVFVPALMWVIWSWGRRV